MNMHTEFAFIACSIKAKYLQRQAIINAPVPVSIPRPTVAELQARLDSLLEEHDPAYMYSDDYRVYCKGNRENTEIQALRRQIGEY